MLKQHEFDTRQTKHTDVTNVFENQIKALSYFTLLKIDRPHSFTIHTRKILNKQTDRKKFIAQLMALVCETRPPFDYTATLS